MVAGGVRRARTERPAARFTVGITDDVSGTEPRLRRVASTSSRPTTLRAVFFGLGSDGTVGRQQEHDQDPRRRGRLYAQGYFVYDSKKSGAQTVSHLRFGPRPIRAPYLVEQASFVGCHHFGLLAQRRGPRARRARRHAAAQLRRIRPPSSGMRSTRPIQEQIVAKGIELYVIDASRIAREAGLGGRINTVLQTCFFAISGVLERDEAITRSRRRSPRATAARRRGGRSELPGGRSRLLEGLRAGRGPRAATIDARAARRSSRRTRRRSCATSPAQMMAGRGDELPVSALPATARGRAARRPTRSARSPSSSPCGTPSSASSAAIAASSARTASSARSTTTDRSSTAPRPRFRSAPLRRARAPRHRLHVAGLRGRLHGLRALRRGLPGPGADDPASQGDQPHRLEPLARGRAATTSRSSRRCRSPTAPASDFGTRTRHPVPPAAVRVLRRLRRLRRDAVPEAPVPALRRPGGDRQRHRLLVDLRRQPAHHAVDDRRRGARPGVVELAVRGQRRVRPRPAARRRPPPRARPAHGSRSCATCSAPSSSTPSSTRRSSRSRTCTPSALRVAELEAPARRAWTGPRRARSGQRRRPPRATERVDRGR